MSHETKTATLRARVKSALGRPVRRDAGIALIIVTVAITILGAVAGDFAYSTRVDLEAASNGRDELRAEYLARSGIQLARLLIKVQQSVIDRNVQYLGDIQIGDFAPLLVGAFAGSTEERAGLGAFLGIDASQVKGLGVGKNATFDVQMRSDDGRLNINCGGGFNDVTHQQQLYGILSALMFPPRYNKLFEQSDADGQYYTRDDVTRAVIDWADVDETRFAPLITNGQAGSSSTGSEDYRYDTGRDPYRAHNMFYDTVEEVNLVRGVGDGWWGSFGELLTAYGGCKINISAVRPENWPLVAAIIRATVKDEHKTDSALLDDVLLAQLAQQIMSLAQFTGGFSSVDQFISLISDPAAALKSLSAGTGSTNPPPPSSGSSQIAGVPLDPVKVKAVLTTGPRRIYRLDSTGTIQRTANKKIDIHIRAIWDSAHFNQNTTSGDVNDRQGTWVYWRQE